ncbi:response regulator transcription factor [Nocardia jejuensis]|uniref:response regulator transcription factor n=1 Tax=Nocardia jejuensis TaxID=328049 RepID=UPI000829A0E7|nr:response regulator transcription factor [Nocardia jejuensis]
MADERAPIRIVIVDDDHLVRTALSLILGGDASLQIVGQAGDGAAALSVIRAHSPDVVLMDVRMPGRDGLSATTEILTWSAPPRILILTTFDSDEMVLHALRIGAHGFLLKDTPPSELVAAVKAVAAGRPTLSPSVTTQVIAAATATTRRTRIREARRADARRELSVLTDRELEIARAIARGHANAEIAARLYLSVATVKTHTSNLLTKLGLDNRVQIALLVHDSDY